jgi:hypothetical protein
MNAVEHYEAAALAMFNRLWPAGQYEWEDERLHFCDKFSRFGPEIFSEAAYQLERGRKRKPIQNEMGYLFGIIDRLHADGFGPHRRSGTTEEHRGHRTTDAGKAINAPYDSYLEYEAHVIEETMRLYPDPNEPLEPGQVIPESDIQRREELERYLGELRDTFVARRC